MLFPNATRRKIGVAFAFPSLQLYPLFLKPSFETGSAKSMKRLSLSVQPRQQIGRNASNRVRNAGSIPAVIYGRNGTRALQIKQTDFRVLYKQTIGSVCLVEVTEEGREGSCLTLLQEVQRVPTTDGFRHVDFREVQKDEKISTRVKIHVVGEAYGVKNEGANLDLVRHDIPIRCFPLDLPDHITVDVSPMKAGDSIHLRDLAKIPGVEFMGDQSQTIVVCTVPAAEEEEAKPAADAAAAAAAPAAGAAAPAAAAAGDKKAEAAKPAAKK
jgi:large subunit ribosomal protein L25